MVQYCINNVLMSMVDLWHRNFFCLKESLGQDS